MRRPGKAEAPRALEPRAAAAAILAAVDRSAADADEALAAVLERHRGADPRDRRLLHELVMGTLRMRGALDARIARASSRALTDIDPYALEALRVAAYQMTFLDRIPAHAAVNAAVASVKARRRGGGAAGFVNAVLRRLPAIGLPDGDAARSHPAWIVEMFERLIGPDETAALCTADNLEPPFTIRAVARRNTREALRQTLAREGMVAAACSFAPHGLVLEHGIDPADSPSFRDGLWTVQDEAAQIPSLVLDPRPGERILDACAAPGGKTAHLADLTGDRAEIVAVDRDPKRLVLVTATAARLRLSGIATVLADAAGPLPFPAGSFDRILVDAPCTGLGTVRRSPEIKWRVTRGDPARLARTQSAILGNCAKYLKRGGVLVYSVCTVTDEEGPGVAEAFLDESVGIRPSPPPPTLGLGSMMMDGGASARRPPRPFIRTWPHRHGTDGFFIARFMKTA